MNTPTKSESPSGLHQRYLIRKIVGIQRTGFMQAELVTEEIDKNSEYFVMRLDVGGKDKVHVNACRKAVLHYAELIKDHLPELSHDLTNRYSETV